MKEKLISKKDLLLETGISYGQLYRWKRKNIIPEEWFIKKSTFTGQETFFPKEKILERINTILSMKEGVSLDEIANMFIEKKCSKEYELDFLLDKKAISSYTKELFINLCNNYKVIGKKELLILNIIETYVLTSLITVDEVKSIIQLLEQNFTDIFNNNGKIYLFRKMGIPFVIGCRSDNKVVVDGNSMKILEVDVVKEISDISFKLI